MLLYDLSLRVPALLGAAAPPRRARRARARELGRPLARGGIRMSLRKGGTIVLTVSCRGGGDVATSVCTAPRG